MSALATHTEVPPAAADGAGAARGRARDGSRPSATKEPRGRRGEREGERDGPATGAVTHVEGALQSFSEDVGGFAGLRSPLIASDVTPVTAPATKSALLVLILAALVSAPVVPSVLTPDIAAPLKVTLSTTSRVYYAVLSLALTDNIRHSFARACVHKMLALTRTLRALVPVRWSTPGRTSEDAYPLPHSRSKVNKWTSTRTFREQCSTSSATDRRGAARREREQRAEKKAMSASSQARPARLHSRGRAAQAVCYGSRSMSSAWPLRQLVRL